jgi:hypothetical protein
MKVDESYSIASYYTIAGYSGTLTTKQKLCTYVSSNEAVVAISGKVMKAAAVGQSTITVTSSADPTKSCSFAVTVKDVVFDRNISTIQADDDVACELPEDGGYVETKAEADDYLFFKGLSATSWMTSATLKLNAVLTGEDWPKLGVGTTTSDNGGLNSNQIYFHLNAENPHDDNPSFTELGVVEVADVTQWAWNPTVQDATARHKDHAFALSAGIGYSTEFTMTLVRDGFDFHLWFNGVYAFSVTTLHDLFGVADAPVASYPGLFEFNSDVTFSSYSATTDAAAVAAKIASIGTTNFVTAWDQDAS